MADQPAPVEVRRVEFGTSYRVGPVELVVDDDGEAFVQIHGQMVRVGPRELRALRVLMNDPTVMALVEGEDEGRVSYPLDLGRPPLTAEPSVAHQRAHSEAGPARGRRGLGGLLMRLGRRSSSSYFDALPSPRTTNTGTSRSCIAAGNC